MHSLRLFSKLNPGHRISDTIHKKNFLKNLTPRSGQLRERANEVSGDRAGVERMTEGGRRGKDKGGRLPSTEAWNGEKVQWVLLSQSAYFLGCGQHTPFQF